MGNQTLEDSMIADGLTDKFNDYHMGITAENLVEQYQISRKNKINLHSILNKSITCTTSWCI